MLGERLASICKQLGALRMPAAADLVTASSAANAQVTYALLVPDSLHLTVAAGQQQARPAGRGPGAQTAGCTDVCGRQPHL